MNIFISQPQRTSSSRAIANQTVENKSTPTGLHPPQLFLTANAATSLQRYSSTPSTDPPQTIQRENGPGIVPSQEQPPLNHIEQEEEMIFEPDDLADVDSSGYDAAIAEGQRHATIIREHGHEGIKNEILANSANFQGEELEEYLNLIRPAYQEFQAKQENEAARLDQILQPVETIYKEYDPKAKKSRKSYALLSFDKKIAKARWNLLEDDKKPEKKKVSEKKRQALTDTVENKTKERTEYKPKPKRSRKSAVPEKPQEAAPPTKTHLTRYQETIPDRLEVENRLVEAIKTARTEIAGLSDPVAQANAYRLLNEFSPFQYQITNANILYDDDPAGLRTCNINSVAMCLHALGITPADYQGTPERMQQIAAAYTGELSDKGGKITADFTKIPLPDFLQLVAIDLHIGEGEVNAESIAKGRDAAYGKILSIYFLKDVVEKFGVKGSVKSHKIGRKLKGSGKERSTIEILDAFGKITKSSGNRSDPDKKRDWTKQKNSSDWMVKMAPAYSASAAELDKLLAKVSADTADAAAVSDLVQPVLTSIDDRMKLADAGFWKKTRSFKIKQINRALSKFTAKQTERNKKKLIDALSASKKIFQKQDALTKVDMYKYAGSYEDMQQVLSIDDYQAGFVEKVTQALSGGEQIVVNLASHYVRLQSMDDDGFTVDDPGGSGKEGMRVTWNQAIADGYFKRYLVVS